MLSSSGLLGQPKRARSGNLESGDGTRWFVSRRLGPKGNGGSSNKQSSSSQRRAVCNMFAESVGDVATTWIESSSRSSSG